MAKRLRRDPIYIAPEILGWLDENYNPIVIDERNGNIALDPHNVNDKIIIYQRQVEEWFLKPASKMLRYSPKNKGFIVLMICLSYLEGVEQYRRGQSSNNQSAVFFKNAVHKLYPNRFSDNQVTELYRQARCGLFHNGMVSGKIIINNSFPQSLDFVNNDEIKVSPSKLLADIKRDFEIFINELNDDQDAKNRFNQMFSNL